VVGGQSRFLTGLSDRFGMTKSLRVLQTGSERQRI
jgi:hypothetical protein